MPTYLANVRGKYALWSTIVDAPITCLYDTLQELAEVYQYGIYREAEYEKFKQYRGGIYAESIPKADLTDWQRIEQRRITAYNRAGPNESRATLTEMLRSRTATPQRKEREKAYWKAYWEHRLLQDKAEALQNGSNETLKR
jgi:hypothetical protein